MDRGETASVAVQRRQWTAEITVGLAVVLLFFLFLGARDLWNPNEPLYSLGVKEMAQRGDWLIPTINGTVYPEKPILYYWGALAAARLLGGVSEFTLRVPSALAASLSFWLVYALVLGYRGRRAALWTAALFATQYMVFWSGRAVQMDILVVASTLGVLLPLCRSADLGFSPVKAWWLAGIAAGLGFLAKGPVAWILPAIAFCGYALWTHRPRLFLNRHVLLGAVAAIAVAAPWYGLLLWNGHEEFLHNVLIKQNFQRFVAAWDHQQPWWYYLKYIWIDLAPWSWFLPLAAVLGWRTLRARTQEESGPADRLNALSWIWIVGTILFFSLSQSKRSPYILPIAPAVAILTADVLDRLAEGRLRGGLRWSVLGIHGLFGLLFALAGAGLWWRRAAFPELGSTVPLLAAILVVGGSAVLGSLHLARHHPRGITASLLAAVFALFLSSTICLPSANTLKSARGFAQTLEANIGKDAPLRSYAFWFGRTGYSYYSDRIIPNLEGPEPLQEYWSAEDPAYLLVEEPHMKEAVHTLGNPQLLLRQKVGGRTAYLLGKAGPTQEEAITLPSGVEANLEPLLSRHPAPYQVFLREEGGQLEYCFRWRTAGTEEACVLEDGTVIAAVTPAGQSSGMSPGEAVPPPPVPGPRSSPGDTG
jgi:4-amino-4-deoxy-L-arabinose transferase-like glycosyltransferase